MRVWNWNKSAACPDGHHDLFEGSISCPFTDSIDRALHLSGAVLDGGKRIRNGQAEIIMAVNAQRHLLDSLHPLPEGSNEVSKLGGDGVAHRVRNVDGRCPCLDGPFDHRQRNSNIASGGIHGREFDIARIAPCPCHRLGGNLDDFLLRFLQLVFEMDVGS